MRMSEQKLVLWVTRLQSLAFTGKCRDFFHLVCTDWSLSRLLHALGMHREQWKWPSPSPRRRGHVIRNIRSVVGIFIFITQTHIHTDNFLTPWARSQKIVPFSTTRRGVHSLYIMCNVPSLIYVFLSEQLLRSLWSACLQQDRCSDFH